MKELKVIVQFNEDNKVISIEPVNKVAGTASATKLMTARLLTQAEIDRETRELMQDGIHTYHRVNRRVRQMK